MVAETVAPKEQEATAEPVETEADTSKKLEDNEKAKDLPEASPEAEKGSNEGRWRGWFGGERDRFESLLLWIGNMG